MASIFAKRALRDIAQSMGKKKTEEELRAERFAVQDDAAVRAAVTANQIATINNRLPQITAGIKAGSAAGIMNATGVPANDRYLFDRRAAAERDAVMEQKRNAYARYIADQHPSLPTDAATRENVMYSVGTRTPEMHEYEHAIRFLQGNREANEANARARAYEKSNPDAKRATDALYSLFNDKAVVNPLGDPAQLRYMEQLHRNKAAGYETGSWEAVQRGVRSTMTADEMARQASIMENPLKALENVNRQIETLEGTRTSAFWAEEDNKKQVDDALEKLGRQRILLEAALTEDPVKGAKDERDLLTIQSGQNGRGGASRYDPEQLRSLANYLKYMPDGLTLDDYEPETIGMTIMLTAQEKQKYENLRAQDPAKAQEYLRAMESIINERKAQADAGFAEEFTERAPVAANVVATAANVLSPIGSVYATVQQLRGEDVDPNSPWFGTDRLSGTVRGKTEQMIDDSIDSEGWSKAAKFMYNAGTSVIDNGLRMLINKGIGLGGNMSTALMAYGGYGNSVREVLEGGGTQEQAMMVGIANAVSEFATEVLPEKFFMRSMSDISTKGWKKFGKDMLEAVMGDGLGEAANSMISTVADQAIRGYGGKIAMAADKYMYDGVAKSAQEAYKLAWKDALGSAMYEGLMGAVSAGLLEGGIDVVTSTVASRRDKKQQLEELAREKEAQEQQAQQPVPEAQQEPTLESIAEDVNLKPAAQATGTVTVKTPEEVRAAKPVETKKTEEKAGKRRKAGLEVAVGDEGYTIKKDGETANMDDLDADDADAQMLHNAEGMSAEAANDMLSLYDEKGETGAKDYAKGYKAAYEAGVKGEAFEDTGKLFAGDLTESQRRSAWELGQKARAEANTRAEHLTRQHAARNGFRARSMADGVSFENVQSEITAAEKSTFSLLDAFGKRWGLNIRIYDTLEGGRANASYLSGTNVVNIARDAEGGALVRAASHEVYHYLEQFAKDDALKIRTFVLDKLRSNEEYDLEGELQKYRARYENVQDADVEAELVADSLLDVIGTEENIRAMAQDSPNLLNRIVDVIKRIREYLRGQLERLSRTSETVAMMMQDEAALAEVQRMAEEGLANAKANRDAQSRVMSTAMQDSAVQQYMEDVGKAGNDAERAGYLESLAQQTYARTQAQVYGQTGDYDGGFDVFRSVLKDFADGKGALNALLKDAGLAESQSQQDNAVMAFIGRELKRVDGQGAQRYEVYDASGEKIAGVVDGAAVKYNLRTWTKEEQQRVRDAMVKAGFELDRVNKWIRDLNGIAAKIASDPERLDYDEVVIEGQEFLKNNQEYFFTLDGSTLCPKKRWYQGTFDMVQRMLPNKPLYSADILRLRKMLKEKGYVVPCGVCYVESRRRHLGRFTKKWMKEYTGEYKPTYDEVNTVQGLEKLRNEHPKTYDDFVTWMNRRGVSNPKLVQLATAYDGDVRKMSERDIEKVKAIGGLRVQSFSDFEVFQMLDMMQAVMDMAAMNLTSQAYTKVPAFAEVFGGTGIKINLSLIAKGTGLDEKGNLIFDDVEGMPYKEAMRLRKKYDKNVGTIIVGTSYEHVLKCMQDDRIDFIIPFHRSGWGINEQRAMGIENYMDFTQSQNERNIHTKEKMKRNLYPADYWQEGKSGKENAEIYLRRCAEEGRIPKFAQFLTNNGDGSYSLKRDGSTDGYWKLLIDYRMYDNAGNFAKQETVKPEFDMAAARKILKTFDGIGNTLPAVKEVAEEFVEDYHRREEEARRRRAKKAEKERQKAQGVQYSLRSDGVMEYSRKDVENMNFFAEIATEDEVREAGKLINKLEKMRRETGFATGQWMEKTGELSKKLLEDTYSTMNQGVLTRRINTMYKAMDEGNVTPNQLMEYAYAIAEKVAEGAGQVQELGEGEREARDYIRGVRIYLTEDMQSEVRARYGSLRSFYNRNFGRAKFTTNKRATSLEEMWPELNNMAPGYFPEDTDVYAMPEVLEAFLEATGKVHRDYFGASEEQLKQDVAMRLFWNYYQMPGTYTHLRQQEKEMVERMSVMMEGMRETFEQRVQDRVTSILQREERERIIPAIERKMRTMAKRYETPTRDKHIPEHLRTLVSNLIVAVDNGGGKDGKLYMDVASEIRRLRQEDQDLMINIINVEDVLDDLASAAANKTLRQMTFEQVEALKEVVDVIHHACVAADKIRVAGQEGSVRVLATELHETANVRKNRKVLGNVKQAVKGAKYNLMDAKRFFKELEYNLGKGANEMWTILRTNGFDTMARNMDEASKLFEEKLSKYDYQKWTGKQAEKHVVQVMGEKIELSTGQIMSLYMLNQRAQARPHLYGADGNSEDGGIIASRVETKKGMVEGVKPYHVTPAQVNEICKLLSKEQKECANALGEILTSWCAQKGNETSMYLYGIEMYKEDNYFPIEVWQGRKNVTQEEQNSTNMYALFNKGWTKNLVKRAQAPLVLKDIFDVVGKHTNEVILYNAWGGPLRDLIQVMNYKGKELETFDMEKKKTQVLTDKTWGVNDSVRGDIERVMGKEAYEYLVQLVKDLNGMVVNKVEKGYSAALSGKMLRNFKATAVGANLGTVVKQPTSVLRAFEVIPARYFVGRSTEHDEKTVDLIKRYAPVMAWKQFGFFTMDTGKSTQSVLFPKTDTLTDKISDMSMWGAGKADEVTWISIWKAAERMTRSMHENLAEGSEAFYKQTAEYFNRCIDETQTVDSVLHRPELMRQKTEWVKMVTTFMGEPLKTYNMVLDKYNALRAGNTKQAKRAFAVAVTAYAATNVTVAFINSLISALRNWDDEDPFWEQVMGRFIGEYDEDMTAWQKAKEFLLNSDLMNELNLLNKIPIAKDLMEVLRGYDVEREDMDTISAVIDAVNGMWDEKYTWQKKTLNLLGAVGNAFGIPANNVIKEVRNVWNISMRAAENMGINTLPMQYALLRFEKDMNAKNMSDYADFIVKAEHAGKTEYAAEIRKEMLEAGIEAEDLDSKLYKTDVERLTGIKNASYAKTYAALGMAIRAGDEELVDSLTGALKRGDRTDEQIADGLAEWLTEDPRVISAAQKAADGDVSEKATLAATLRSEGFDDAVGKRAINRAQDRIIDERKKAETPAKEETKQESTYEALYTYYDLQTAIEDGDGVSEIMADLRKQGKTDSTIKSQITSRIKPVYVALMRGTPSDKAQARKIKEQLLKLDLENRYTEEAINKWLK